MDFGGFTLLFGYPGYLVLAIPIGIIGLVIFIYDLATYGKQYDQWYKIGTVLELNRDGYGIDMGIYIW